MDTVRQPYENSGSNRRSRGGEVSHENGTAVVTLAAEVADEVLKKAVEDKDYKVTGIE